MDVTRRFLTRDRPSISADCMPDTKYCSSGLPERSSNGSTAIENGEIESSRRTVPGSIRVANWKMTATATTDRAASNAKSVRRRDASKSSSGLAGGVRVMPSSETS